jgi:two-component system response regulator YesN
MIVDDEKNVRDLLAMIVNWEKEGFRIASEAEDGIQALERFSVQPVDIIIADIDMPNMNGLDLAEFAYHHFPTTKVIILTAYNEFEFARRALNTGVYYYILKPIDENELLHVVKKAARELERHEESHPAANAPAQGGRNTHYGNSKMVEKALLFVKDNIQRRDLNVSMMADNLYINRDYLTVLFKKELGISMVKYLMNYRMMKSKEMLDAGCTDIECILDCIGFSDRNYFLRCFKKRFGISPSKYLKEKYNRC